MNEKVTQPSIGHQEPQAASKPHTLSHRPSPSLKAPRLAFIALFLLLLSLSFVALRLGLSGADDDPIGIVTDHLTDTFSYGQPDYGDGLTVEALEALKADGVTSFDDGQPEKEILDSLLYGNVSRNDTDEGPYSFSEELGEVDWDALLRGADRGGDMRVVGGDYIEGTNTASSSNPASTTSLSTTTSSTTTTTTTTTSSSSSRGGGSHSLPRFAFGIFAAPHDAPRVVRLLLATYHPRHHYLIHIDGTKAVRKVARLISTHPFLGLQSNIQIVPDPEPITYLGSTLLAVSMRVMQAYVSSTLEWDWFINLSASDYPLVTPDDMLNIFSLVPRGTNFMQHTASPQFDYRQEYLFIDYTLFSRRRLGHWMKAKRRPLATKFTVFKGSNWQVLSKDFLNHVFNEPKEEPRRILMYMGYFMAPDEHYFQTVLCANPSFVPTVINHTLHFHAFQPHGPHAIMMQPQHFQSMLHDSAYLFARKFTPDSPMMDVIDRHILNRAPEQVTPGSWCAATCKSQSSSSSSSSNTASSSVVSAQNSSSNNGGLAAVTTGEGDWKPVVSAWTLTHEAIKMAKEKAAAVVAAAAAAATQAKGSALLPKSDPGKQPAQTQSDGKGNRKVEARGGPATGAANTASTAANADHAPAAVTASDTTASSTLNGSLSKPSVPATTPAATTVDAADAAASADAHAAAAAAASAASGSVAADVPPSEDQEAKQAKPDGSRRRLSDDRASEDGAASASSSNKSSSNGGSDPEGESGSGGGSSKQEDEKKGGKDNSSSDDGGGRGGNDSSSSTSSSSDSGNKGGQEDGNEQVEEGGGLIPCDRCSAVDINAALPPLSQHAQELLKRLQAVMASRSKCSKWDREEPKKEEKANRRLLGDVKGGSGSAFELGIESGLGFDPEFLASREW